MKTIALKERTFELLKELKEKVRTRSFDELIIELIFEKEEVPQSMFGILKGKTRSFTPAERRRIWKDKHREELLQRE